MNVGYYYHIEAAFESPSEVRVPSHFGLFVTELARLAGCVTLYLHEGPPNEVQDMVLGDSRVEVISLGPRRRAPAMTFWPWPSLRNFRPQEHGVDVMVIRGPSPLLPHLRREASDLPVALQLVGDTANWTPQTFFAWWRNVLISLWVRLYVRQQEAAARGTLVLVKSDALTRRSGEPYEGSMVSFTSSLPQSAVASVIDTRWGPEKGLTEPVRLLYTGRIVKDKGLFEAVRSIASLAQRGLFVELRLVGWSDARDPTATELTALARHLGVPGRVVFAGYRAAGEELMAEYRGADAYVSPTYGEGGVSKSIVEAMASGLPVITTRIPAVEGALIDGENVLLVAPGSVEELTAATERLIRDDTLRGHIAVGARRWAEGFTIERSVSVMVEHLREWLHTEAPSVNDR